MRQPDISVVIPAFNEEKRLPRTLAAYLTDIKRVTADYEIIIVNDGSLDNTSQVIHQAAKKNHRLIAIDLPTNQGKGAAVRAGMLRARGRVVLMVDADNTTPLTEITHLQTALNRGADIAIGSRYVAGSRILTPQPIYRRLISRVGNLVIKLLLLRGINDTQCGFKLFRSSIIKSVFSRQTITGFGFDVELLTIAKTLGQSIVEVPITWRNDGTTHLHPLVDTARFLKEVYTIKRRQLAGGYR